MAEYIEKQAAVSYAISGMVRTLPTNDGNENWIRTSEVRKNILSIPAADVVPTEPQEIGYDQCANAMLKMWMDNVVTDGEYNRIMDRLNKLYFSGGEREE
jgi:hypothetical protein